MLRQLIPDSYSLLVSPTLAQAIGLEQALVLQQVHYWLNKCGKEVNGKTWMYNTLEQWHGQFKFWSIRKLQRTIAALEKSGLLESGQFHRNKQIRTKWYTINKERLARLIKTIVPEEQDPLEEKQGSLFPASENNTDLPPETSKIALRQIDQMYITKTTIKSISTTTGSTTTGSTNSENQILNRALALTLEQETPNIKKTWNPDPMNKAEELEFFKSFTLSKKSTYILENSVFNKYWVTSDYGQAYKRYIENNKPPFKEYGEFWNHRNANRYFPLWLKSTIQMKKETESQGKTFIHYHNRMAYKEAKPYLKDEKSRFSSSDIVFKKQAPKSVEMPNVNRQLQDLRDLKAGIELKARKTEALAVKTVIDSWNPQKERQIKRRFEKFMSSTSNGAFSPFKEKFKEKKWNYPGADFLFEAFVSEHYVSKSEAEYLEEAFTATGDTMIRNYSELCKKITELENMAQLQYQKKEVELIESACNSSNLLPFLLITSGSEDVCLHARP